MGDNFNYKLLIYVFIVIIAIVITLFTFDTWHTIGFICMLLLSISYLFVLVTDKLTTLNYTSIQEGFVTETASEASKYEWLSNEDLFDDFYASIFTKLTQNEKLVTAEVLICMDEFTKNITKDQLIVLDAGCGIGVGTAAFAKQDAGTVVGIDKSQAMIRYAKGTTLPNTTLNDIQKQNIEFRQFDLVGPGAAGAAEFTHAVLLYFTVYYFKDLSALFRNLALWVKPGGTLVVEVVNKYKFEPVLDSSNPWVGFSPQKYSKDRLTKSKVVFDKFDYDAEFDLEDTRAEFRETIRFKDGSIRRQKHTLYMPNISDIIKSAQNNGWTYTKYVDLMPISFPYGYLLFFNRNAF
jgi:SAM-dependent methyltransferase